MTFAGGAGAGINLEIGRHFPAPRLIGGLPGKFSPRRTDRGGRLTFVSIPTEDREERG